MNLHRFARLISFALHPVVFAVLVPFLVVYKESASLLYGLKWAFIASFFLFSASSIFFLVRTPDVIKDMDNDMDISKKEHRHILYSVFALFAIIFFVVSLLFKGVFFPLSIVALGMIFGIVLSDLLNYYIKVSIHAAVVTAYIITFGVLYGLLPFFGVAWILFLIVWSRLYLKKHTTTELLAGIILGAFVTIATVYVGRHLVP